MNLRSNSMEEIPFVDYIFQVLGAIDRVVESYNYLREECQKKEKFKSKWEEEYKNVREKIVELLATADDSLPDLESFQKNVVDKMAELRSSLSDDISEDQKMKIAVNLKLLLRNLAVVLLVLSVGLGAMGVVVVSQGAALPALLTFVSVSTTSETFLVLSGCTASLAVAVGTVAAFWSLAVRRVFESADMAEAPVQDVSESEFDNLNRKLAQEGKNIVSKAVVNVVVKQTYKFLRKDSAGQKMMEERLHILEKLLKGVVLLFEHEPAEYEHVDDLCQLAEDVMNMNMEELVEEKELLKLLLDRLQEARQKVKLQRAELLAEHEAVNAATVSAATAVAAIEQTSAKEQSTKQMKKQ